MLLKIHSKAPNFKLPNQENQIIELNSIKKNIVLFFYPKDNTPGCTLEAKGFSEFKSEFNKLQCYILGISKDSIKKHQNFIQKQSLTIDLLSDENNQICENYGVWVEKSMYGRKYMGIERSTFIIDTKKKVVNIWSKVKVANHVKEVLDFAKNHFT